MQNGSCQVCLNNGIIYICIKKLITVTHSMKGPTWVSQYITLPVAYKPVALETRKCGI